MFQRQGKVNDRGIAALAYNVLLRPGVTVGLGLSLDTQKINDGPHKVRRASLWMKAALTIFKIGTSFTFEG